jgi:ureidoacrylate peracid hydrolase
VLANAAPGAAGLPVEAWTTPVHRPPLTSLPAKLQTSHAALLVIDVLNDFAAEGGMMASEGLRLDHVQAMAARLPALVEAARAAGVLVVFVRNEYSTERNAYLSDAWLDVASRRGDGRSYTQRAACSPDSWENDFYGDLRPQDGEPVITKHRFSAFHQTDLDLVLRTHGIRTIVLTGAVTNVCVESTARDGFFRDYHVVFTSDGTAAYSMEEHEATLKTIGRYFGVVVPIDEVRACWS